MKRFTVLIPIHNEANILLQNFNLLASFLDTFSHDYDILLIENGSKDGTAELLRKVEQINGNVSSAAMPEANLGLALCKGITLSASEYVVYVPIDLSVGLDFIPASIRSLEFCDIAVGSKRLKASSDQRSTLRKLCSICYHYLVKLLFGTDLSDTTCVKAFKKSSILPLLRSIRFTHILDTELLIKAERAGYNIQEMPVDVRDRRLPKENLLLKIVRKSVELIAFRIASTEETACLEYS